jgi:hypothetical protein
MTVSSIPTTPAAASAVSAGAIAGSVQTAVLGAVLQTTAQDAVSLINSIPQVAPLATSGNLGTRVNTYA